jgi:hypothetical protein
MPVEAMAGVTEEVAVTMEGMLVADMLRLVMLRVDTLVSVLGVDVVTRWRGPRAETCVMRVARVIGTAAVIGEVVAVTGEAVIGEAVTGIRRMDILGSAFTAWVMVIRTTRIIPGDITLTATDTGRT